MHQEFKLGPWVVRPTLNSVSRNGHSVHLEPKAMEVLVCLAQDGGNVVSKEKLIAEVWADTFVGDDVLVRCISELRRALEDDAKAPLVIETIPKRGYRLLTEVNQIPVPPKRLRLIIWVAVAAVAVGTAAKFLWPRPPSIRSIAVLPFRNLSDDPAEDYLAAGITYSVTNQLAQIGALRVTSYTSALTYRDTKKSLGAIAGELKVDAIIEGAVMRSGGRTRLEVQLIDARTDRQIWAKDYQVEQNTMVGLAGESARQMAATFRVRPTPQEEARLARSATSNPSAYEAYLKGRFFWSKDSTAGRVRAVEFFQQAVDVDPDYADAYVGLADCYLDIARYTPARDGYMPKAKAALEKALALDPSLEEAHFSLAYLHAFYDYDWEGAQREFDRGFELNPSYAMGHSLHSIYLTALGRHDEAIVEAKRALELDPVSLIINTNLGRAYFFARQLDPAIQQLRATLLLDPTFPMAYGWLGAAYYQKGNIHEAIHEGEIGMRLNGDPTSDLERVYSAEGIAGMQRLDLKDALQDVKDGNPGATDVAAAYAVLGNRDAAFAWLDKAYASREASLALVKAKWDFDNVRSDPRYRELLHRMGLPE